MHPTIGRELAQARIADLHRDAQRAARARAAARPGRPRILASLRPRRRPWPATIPAAQPR